ncbi:penicillin-binding protein activator [Halomonas sp. YLGW01]|uniref:penicillin-binding protein activator n=1 Tax=Halomonas sp. YLGW01 TaxID=2773308 RepID=UPI0017826D36|nr:penicillin-binding protein activator [Halomonas sp. YLGW01]
MNTSSRGLVAAALLALLVGGCAAPTGMMQPTERSPEALLAQAEQQAAEPAADSRLEAALILARRGEAAKAKEIAAGLDDTALGAERRQAWALLLSRLGLEAEDPDSVLKATALLDVDMTLEPDAANNLRYRRGLALGMLGEPLDAAKAMLAAQAASGSEVPNDAIWQQLTRLTAQERIALRDEADALTRGWLSLLELQRQSGGDVDRLLDQISNWRAEHHDHPAARQPPAELLALRELRGTRIDRIAILLPESGPLASVAGRIRQGIETRHAQARRQGSAAPALDFIDSSQRDLNTLYAEATMRGAQVVIGPLSKRKVSELEQRQRLPLPTLALNYGTATRNNAENLFQYGLSAEDEARQVASRAARDGHRRAAAMVPNNAWGRRVGTAYRETFEDQGGDIGHLMHYDPKALVNDSVKRLLDLSGQVDMLFLLGLPSYARQVPPTLDYQKVPDLPVYTTSQAYEGRPQPRVDHDLNGVRFVEIPWLIPDAAVGGAEALPYYESYRRLSAEIDDPALLKLSAMGVDAYELGLRLPQFQAIHGSELFGATGTLRAASDGRIQRQLPWAEFIDGRPQPPLRAEGERVLGSTAASRERQGDDQP